MGEFEDDEFAMQVSSIFKCGRCRAKTVTFQVPTHFNPHIYVTQLNAETLRTLAACSSAMSLFRE